MIPVDSAGHSPFRAAIEAKDFDAAIATLADDVVFRSPAVFAPYEGRAAVGMLLGAVSHVLGPTIAYEWQVREGDREVLNFSAEVNGRTVEGVDLLTYDAEGRVSELVVMIRPLSALMAVRDAMAALLSASSGS